MNCRTNDNYRGRLAERNGRDDHVKRTVRVLTTSRDKLQKALDTILFNKQLSRGRGKKKKNEKKDDEQCSVTRRHRRAGEK